MAEPINEELFLFKKRQPRLEPLKLIEFLRELYATPLRMIEGTGMEVYINAYFIIMYTPDLKPEQLPMSLLIRVAIDYAAYSCVALIAIGKRIVKNKENSDPKMAEEIKKEEEEFDAQLGNCIACLYRMSTSELVEIAAHAAYLRLYVWKIFRHKERSEYRDQLTPFDLIRLQKIGPIREWEILTRLLQKERAVKVIPVK